MIHVSPSHRAVIVPTRPDLESLFEEAPLLTRGGKQYIVLPHNSVSTRLLRNMDIECPAPVLSQYDWCGGTPFDVQRKTCAMLTTSKRAYVLNGMGTGKTKSAIWGWDFLKKSGDAQKALVVAPLSTLQFTWAREIFATTPHRKAVVLHGSKQKRLKLLADPEADIFVINHDGIGVILDELNKRSDIDTLILDELAVYRNGGSERTKKMKTLAKRFNWVWGMTGSPTPNEPTDAWAQATIITPDRVPKYYGRFRDELMYKVTQFKWAPKPDALERAFAAMQPAVRYTLDDIVELPDLIERQVDIEMGPKQARLYKTMKDTAYAQIASQEITAMNAGVVLSKLLQISAGWVYTSGSTVSLDNDARLQQLVDDISSTDRKVLVFVPFVHALNGIEAQLKKEGIDCITVSGATPSRDRSEIFTLFQNTDKYRVIIAHPQCMAHGLTLTSASTIIWFSPTTSLEIFEQANARVRRVGQKHKQQVLMYQATDAERKMYARLRSKQKVQNLLLDMFADASR